MNLKKNERPSAAYGRVSYLVAETVHLPNLHRYANREIEFLFTGQWNKWQRFADVVGLPQEYCASDPQTDDEKQTNFILSCRSDLMKHVTT